MTKYIKTLAFLLIAVMLTSPSSAKVIKVDYSDGNMVGKSGLLSAKIQTCSAAGFLSQRPKGNKCSVTKLSGGAVCYKDCSCDKDKYPLSEEELKGLDGKIVVSGESCKDKDGLWFTNYSCGQDLINSTQAEKYKQYFDVDSSGAKTTANVGGKSLTCYDPSKFTCKSTLKEFTSSKPAAIASKGIGGAGVLTSVRSPDEPIEYTVADNGAGKLCVVGVKALLDGAFDKTPTNNRCGEVTTKTAKFFDKDYSFFSGCKTSGDCGAVSDTCVAEAEEQVKIFNTANNTATIKTCKYASGCKTGLVGDSICDRMKKIPEGVVATVSGKECMTITCGAGYEEFARGSDKLRAINTAGKIDESIEFEAEKLHETAAYKEISGLCEGSECNTMNITVVKSTDTNVDPDLNTNNGADIICSGLGCRDVLAYAKANFTLEAKEATIASDAEIAVEKSDTSNLICKGSQCQKLFDFGFAKYVANSIDVAQTTLQTRANDARIDKSLLTVESKYIDPTLITKIDDKGLAEKETTATPTSTEGTDTNVSYNTGKFGGQYATEYNGSIEAGLVTDYVAQKIEPSVNVAATYKKQMHLTGVNKDGEFGYLVCRKPMCPANSTYDASQEACVCQSGYLATDNICEEGKTYCHSKAMVYDELLGNCSRCLIGTFLDKETNTCKSMCGEGQEFDNISRKCKSICKVTEIYDATTKTCTDGPAYCAKDIKVFDAETGTCKGCDEGYELYASGTDKLKAFNTDGLICKDCQFSIAKFTEIPLYKETAELCKDAECKNVLVEFKPREGNLDIPVALRENNGAELACTGLACRELLTYTKVNYTFEAVAVRGEAEVAKSDVSNLKCYVGEGCQRVKDFGLTKFVGNSIDVAELSLAEREQRPELNRNMFMVESKVVDITLYPKVYKGEVDDSIVNNLSIASTLNTNASLNTSILNKFKDSEYLKAANVEFTEVKMVELPVLEIKDSTSGPAEYLKKMYMTAIDDEGNFGYGICRKPVCPANSTYKPETETCKCDSGYIYAEGTCQKAAEYCATKLLSFSEEIGNCKPCGVGKVLNPDTLQCVCVGGKEEYNGKCMTEQEICVADGGRWVNLMGPKNVVLGGNCFKAAVKYGDVQLACADNQIPYDGKCMTEREYCLATDGIWIGSADTGNPSLMLSGKCLSTVLMKDKQLEACIDPKKPYEGKCMTEEEICTAEGGRWSTGITLPNGTMLNSLNMCMHVVKYDVTDMVMNEMSVDDGTAITTSTIGGTTDDGTTDGGTTDGGITGGVSTGGGGGSSTPKIGGGINCNQYNNATERQRCLDQQKANSSTTELKVNQGGASLGGSGYNAIDGVMLIQ